MIRGDARHLPFPDQMFDLVLTSAPTDLSREDREAAYLEISRVCRGRIVIFANVVGQYVVPGFRYPATPAKFVRHQIGMNSEIGDRVLDPFAGTGVIPLVAGQMGRLGVGVELYQKSGRKA